MDWSQLLNRLNPSREELLDLHNMVHVMLHAKLAEQSLNAYERQLCENNRKIDAIKALRTRTGIGLKEAKEIVDKEFPPQI